MEGVLQNQLAEHLATLASERMGVELRAEHHADTARLLLSWKDKLRAEMRTVDPLPRSHATPRHATPRHAKP